MNVQGWLPILPGVLLWRDSCNVYALLGSNGAVIVDAGTGAWIDHVAELPQPPVALLCTHFFRDHAAGAARAARELGLPVLVPEREVELFRDAVEHHRGRQTYIQYSNYWDHFAPIEDIPVAGLLREAEHLSLGGLDLEVLALPGATITQVGLAFTPAGTGLRAVCAGETIHSPGRVPRVAPLQYLYNDLHGAVEVWHSAAMLRRRGVDVLLPSLGTPITSDTDGALAALQRSMEQLCADRPTESGGFAGDGPALQRVSEHVWTTTITNSASVFVTGASGQAVALDYGYHHWRTAGVGYAPHRLRALRHTLDALRDEAGVERIDVAIPTHYHDDHVAGIPLLQRLHGTRVWAHRSFADLLAHPEASAFPCTDPTPRPVDRILDDAEPARWEGIDFRFAAASGHTRFQHLIGWEVDGIRLAHSGDQYGFMHRDALVRHADEPLLMERITDWGGMVGSDNHVYRGGAFLDSFARSAAWLRAWRPDIVLSGHWPAFVTNDDFFDLLDDRARRYEAAHRAAMPLGPDDVHQEVDSWGGWLWPYRVHVADGEAAVLRATVRNPYPHDARLSVRLVGPAGWTGASAELDAPARAEVNAELSIVPTGSCRRQPIALELTVDGQPFGQVAEALVTVGGDRW